MPNLRGGLLKVVGTADHHLKLGHHLWPHHLWPHHKVVGMASLQGRACLDLDRHRWRHRKVTGTARLQSKGLLEALSYHSQPTKGTTSHPRWPTDTSRR